MICLNSLSRPRPNCPLRWCTHQRAAWLQTRGSIHKIFVVGMGENADPDQTAFIASYVVSFQHVWDFIHAHLICTFQEVSIKTEWPADDKLKQRLSQSSRGRNSKINEPIWPVFELVLDFIHVHIICKFQEHPIKTEWITMMTKSNRSFFSNQGNVTLRLMIRSGQFSNFIEILSISTLSASFRYMQSKLTEIGMTNIIPS